jgi:2-hydroxy-6-oxonona-2,4-dienedioate hydrolase
MSRIQISGIELEYELLGKAGAPACAITPGGRYSKDSPGVPELGAKLAAAGRRVLLWDRPNCGASDCCFDGDGEAKLQAQVLMALVRALDLGPVALLGGSAGSRTAMLAALHEPTAVSHLAVWWISGGILSLLKLGSAYCSDLALAASMGGMEAVAALPAFAEPIRRNPRNRDIILRQDVSKFIATMERWAAGYLPQERYAVPGVTRAELAQLTMPVLVFHGSPVDLYHPAAVSEWLHAAIPHSEMTELPWPGDAFTRRLADSLPIGSGVFLDWPDLAPAIIEFTRR